MPFRAPRTGALALALAIPFLASVPGPLRPRAWDGPGRSGPRPGCDRVAYVVGDSRRTLEHAVLPRTTDRIWADLLGTHGGEAVDGMRHVRYLAEPGYVHPLFRQQLTDLMAGCDRRDRPLIFDFMGTNYGTLLPDRIDDPTFYVEIRGAIAGFYDGAAPQARIVLAELTQDRTAGSAAQQATRARYLDQYNGVLRDLARTQPDRYFFLPAPAAYQGTVVWRDADHETASAALAEYPAADRTGALDAAGVALMGGRRGGVCTLMADPRFGPETYSEGVSLIAYLQDFRRSRAADHWLARTRVTTVGRGPLHPRDAACTP